MTEYKTPEQKQRIAVLDGLRALAITMVVLRHAVQAFWPDMTQPFMPVGPTDLGYFFINGWIGVDLFFVLSGFLITGQLLGSYARKGHMDIRLYTKRRFFRIAPLYYVVLAMTVLHLFPFFPYPGDMEHIGWRVFYHILFLQDYLEPDINVVFWSLAVEIKFYILAPFLLMEVLRFRRARMRYMFFAFVFLCVAFFRYINAYYILEPSADYATYFLEERILFHLCIDGLLAGMLCSLLLRDEYFARWLEKPYAAEILFYAGVAIIGAHMFSGVMVDLGTGFYDKVLQGSFVSGGFALILLGLMGNCSGASLFRGRPLYYIALISYSMYLLHLPLLFLSEVVLKQFVNMGQFPVQIQFLISFPFAFSVVCFFSALSYLAIERPFIRWSHRKKTKP